MSHAPVVWAQREDCVYLTVQVSDLTEPKLKIDGPNFTFDAVGSAEKIPYHVELKFYGEINVDESQHRITGREAFFYLKKKEEGPYWPRLTSEKIKYPWLKVDFAKWKDEDEEDEEEAAPAQEPNLGNMSDMSALLEQMKASGMNMPGMGDMGGLGNMPGMGDLAGPGGYEPDSDDDSDDDDIPGLEEAASED